MQFTPFWKVEVVLFVWIVYETYLCNLFNQRWSQVSQFQTNRECIQSLQVKIQYHKINFISSFLLHLFVHYLTKTIKYNWRSFIMRVLVLKLNFPTPSVETKTQHQFFFFLFHYYRLNIGENNTQSCNSYFFWFFFGIHFQFLFFVGILLFCCGYWKNHDFNSFLDKKKEISPSQPQHKKLEFKSKTKKKNMNSRSNTKKIMNSQKMNYFFWSRSHQYLIGNIVLKI